MHAEIKEKTTTLSSSIGTGMLLLSTSDVSQGTDDYQRIGRQIRIVEIGYRGTLVGGQSNLATDDKYNFVRMTFLKGDTDKMYDVLSSSPPTVTGRLTPGLIAGLDRVLTDQVISLPSPGRDSTGYMPPIRVVSLSKQVNIVVNFGASAYPTPAVSLMLVSDSSLVPHPGFTDGYAYVKFVDY